MKIILRILYLAATVYWRLFKPLTFGVKLLLIQDNEILLVRHSYQKGWYLPGGALKRRETIVEAGHREAREELGATLQSLSLFGIFTNFSQGKSDHMAVFVCQDFTFKGIDNKEIEEAKFFQMDNLPTNVSPGTRNRIQEFLQGEHIPYAGNW